MGKGSGFFILAVLVVLAFVGYKYMNTDEFSEEKIKSAIKRANYCVVDSDCGVIPAQCPFGCYVAVNKDDIPAIEKMVKSYKSNCTYSCVEIKGVGCVDNKCQMRF